MKNLLNNHSKIIIFVFLSLLTIVSLWISYSSSFSSTTRNLFTNLAAGGITAVLTIFGVDQIIKRSNEAKWKEAKKTAKSEMEYLTNMLASHLEIPLGFKITDYEVNSNSIEQGARTVLKQIIDEILNKDMDQLLQRMTTEKWGQLLMNLFLIRQSLSETTQLYSSILPPEILGKLLKTKRIFQNFYFSFGLVPELFTKDQSNWPSNKGGVENNKSIRASLLKGFSMDLKQYFEELKALITLVDNWKA